jgi:hypothetical protein
MLFGGRFLSVEAQQNPPTAADLSKYVQHLMDLQVAFMAPPPPGISVETKEVARQGTSGRNLVVQYHIYLNGAPPEKVYTEGQLTVGSDELTPELEGISVGQKGLLICAGRNALQCGDAQRPDDPIEFTVQPLKGEPFRFAFVSGDTKTKIGVMIVPDPVESRNKGCTLSAVRLNANFQLAFISGEGYPPDTDIHYRFSSETESEKVIRSDAKGAIRLSMLATANGKKAGHAKFEILEASCAPKLSYEWGNP